MLSRVPILQSIGIENSIIVISAPTVHGRDLIRFLVQNNVWPETVKRSEEDLEHIFLRLTDKEAGL